MAWQELVEWWVDEANDDRQPGQRACVGKRLAATVPRDRDVVPPDRDDLDAHRFGAAGIEHLARGGDSNDEEGTAHIGKPRLGERITVPVELECREHFTG